MLITGIVLPYPRANDPKLIENSYKRRYEPLRKSLLNEIGLVYNITKVHVTKGEK